MKKYPKYKAGGAEWIEAIPEHWFVIKVKFVATIYGRIGYRGYTINDIVEKGEGAITISPSNMKENKMDFSNCTYISWFKYDESPEIKIFDGDILFVKTGSTYGKTSFVEYLIEPATINPQILVFKRIKINTKYFYHQLRSKIVRAQVKTSVIGGTIPTISQEKIGNYYILLPKMEEQLSIVRFLDYKIGQIDHFNANRQKQIELLGEQKVALINKAVTKGLNSSVLLKDSGDNILGKVPEHWEIMELKFVARMMRGKFSHRPRNDERLYGGKFPFIQTGDVTKTEKYITSYKQTLNDWGFSVSKMFPIGTVVITIAANIGDIAILDFDACFPDSIVGFFSKQNKTEYLFYLLKSMKEVFLSESIEGTQLNLSVDRLSSIKVAIPTPSEQQEIIDFILLETTNIDTLISKYKRQIDLMQEYRTSLINQAVTGKIDVRDWQPKEKAS